MDEHYDEQTGEYVGPCSDCGSDHGWHAGQETLGGRMECLRRQAEGLDSPALADRIAMTQDWMATAQAVGLGLPSELDEVPSW